MNRTRWTFVAIVAVALLLVGVTLLVRNFSSSGEQAPGLTVDKPEAVKVRMLTALPVEPWVRSAAEKFNAEKRTVDGVPIEVQIEAVDGLTALGRWDRDEYGTLPADVRPEDLTDEERARLANFPVAWIPDSRYLVELANASYDERLGRDVFLTDGEYRARPLAISLFTWGVYDSRAKALLGEVRHAQLDGDPRRRHGQGRLARAGRRPGLGLLQAGDTQPGEERRRTGRHDRRRRRILRPHRHRRRRHHRPRVPALAEGADGRRHRLQQQQSPTRPRTLRSSATAWATAARLLESDLLQNMQGILNRWEDPLRSITPNM